MCGLVSIFAYRDGVPAVDRDELLRIRERMHSRGPDGAGLWISENGRIGLAHRRLAIIDLSETGAQPMSNLEGTLRIVFNGEIYNYRELRQDLEKAGHRFFSTSDTEVLLHLYRKYGRRMVHCLRGMYAFALWDEEKRGLFLARDPFGIKPLYYSDDGSTIRVASQVKALLHGGKIDTTPEPAGHVGFFLWGHVPEPYTLYKGIRALPAGTILWMDSEGRKEIEQFFDIRRELTKTNETAVSMTAEGIRDRLRAAVFDTVRHHLIADVPVGVFLSAGLDSTTLIAVSKEVTTTSLHALTLGFKEFQGTRNDEAPLAALVAKHYGVRHQTSWVTKDDFESEYDRIVDAMDQPSIDGANSYFVSKAAAEVGLKVVLSGLGGDELFGGYPSFWQIPMMAKAFGLVQSIAPLGKGFRYLAGPVLKHLTSPKYASLLEYGGTYGGAYLLRRGLFMPWELYDLLDRDLVRQGLGELRPMFHLEQTVQGLRNSHHKVMALEVAWYMRNQLLRDTDWASMAHSVEIRVPLVDIELFRVVAPMFNSKYAPTKLTMAEVIAAPLRDRMFKRKKTGFSIPVREWLAKSQMSEVEERGLRGWALRLNKPIKHRRILALLTDGFGGHGGIAKFNRDLLTALAADENVSEVTALQRLMPNQSEDIPKKVVYVAESLGGKWNFLRAVLHTLIQKKSFDVVICGHINLAPVAYFAGKLANARVLLITHGIEAWQPTKSHLCNYCATKMDLFVAVSEVTKSRFLMWTGLSQERGRVLPNCFDPASFAPGPKSPILLNRYDLEGKVVLLTCGRLESEERYKGFDEIIELLPELGKVIPNIAYLIIGDGNDMPRLKKKAKQFRVEHRVVFCGFIPEADKADHFRLADVYVMPSKGEGFGIVHLEAMACGIPAVGSIRDGSTEALRGGLLGILVDPSDPADIRRGIVEALTRSKKVPEGLDYFSLSKYSMRVQNLIGEIVQSR